jgi:hypothetical protein
MWLFRKKIDDETLIQLVSRLEKRLIRLEAEQLDLATAQELIRDKDLRKIQFKKQTETEKTEYENPSGLVSGISNRFGPG